MAHFSDASPTHASSFRAKNSFNVDKDYSISMPQEEDKVQIAVTDENGNIPDGHDPVQYDSYPESLDDYKEDDSDEEKEMEAKYGDETSPLLSEGTSTPVAKRSCCNTSMVKLLVTLTTALIVLFIILLYTWIIPSQIYRALNTPLSPLSTGELNILQLGGTSNSTTLRLETRLYLVDLPPAPVKVDVNFSPALLCTLALDSSAEHESPESFGKITIPLVSIPPQSATLDVGPILVNVTIDRIDPLKDLLRAYVGNDSKDCRFGFQSFPLVNLFLGDFRSVSQRWMSISELQSLSFGVGNLSMQDAIMKAFHPELVNYTLDMKNHPGNVVQYFINATVSLNHTGSLPFQLQNQRSTVSFDVYFQMKPIFNIHLGSMMLVYGRQKLFVKLVTDKENSNLLMEWIGMYASGTQTRIAVGNVSFSSAELAWISNILLAVDPIPFTIPGASEDGDFSVNLLSSLS